MAEDDLLRALGTELLRAGRLRAASYPGSVLDNSAFRILWRLVERGPSTQRELAEDLQLERSTVTRQVAAALERGLVERYDAPGRGGRLLRPTAAGDDAYLHDGRLRAARMSDALDELGVERAQGLIADLRAFNDALDRT
ncbi:MarR family transcriptional regulator [Nocardioides sp. W7]|uniref:MarR family winged helix-turn-helix transcriptional regulator n=1 Tax=Nocardioides sp. W7 TaxID=2931390 RepID=UPI001FD4176E|nr:MarR family transcriptional regulator [Nocardioides sp. W7]